MNFSEKINLSRKIRRFEQEIETLFKQGKIKGTVHLAIGQEYPVVDIISQLVEGDIVCATHRGHHCYLALTEDFQGLKDELMGLATGVNGGKNLSQHIYIKDKYYTNGVQGGFSPIACGLAYGLKMNKKENVVVNFIGDGTLGEGVLYESLNLAGLWKLPIIFVLENNRYAMSTKVEDGVSGSINARFQSFGVRHALPWEIRKVYPSFIVLDTYRYCGHSPSDNQLYRSQEEIEQWKARDTLGQA